MAKFAPKSHLTAAIWNWGPFYKEMVQQDQRRHLEEPVLLVWTSTRALSTSPFGAMVPAEVQKTVLAKKAEIASGTYKVFTGPIKDQAGAEKVATGVPMADADLLGFNWFVQGVVGT